MELSSAFDIAITWLRRIEGGWANDAADRGGLTRFGISTKAYPQLDLNQLTWEQARDIYHRDYWRPINGDQLPFALSVVVFDAAVNHGVSAAVRMLQGVVKVTADGVIGPQTLAAIKSRAQHVVVSDYLSTRCGYYHRIVDNDPTQERFIKGWLNRLTGLRQYITEQYPGVLI